MSDALKNHPFRIAIGPNAQMQCFDLQIAFGNFKDKKAAQQFADDLVDLLKTHARGWALRPS